MIQPCMGQSGLPQGEYLMILFSIELNALTMELFSMMCAQCWNQNQSSPLFAHDQCKYATIYED